MSRFVQHELSQLVTLRALSYYNNGSVLRRYIDDVSQLASRCRRYAATTDYIMALALLVHIRLCQGAEKTPRNSMAMRFRTKVVLRVFVHIRSGLGIVDLLHIVVVIHSFAH